MACFPLRFHHRARLGAKAQDAKALVVSTALVLASACSAASGTQGGGAKKVWPEVPDEERALAVGLVVFEPCGGGPNEASERRVYTCGGTRIGEDIVMTAAHCAQWEKDVVADEIYVWSDTEAMRQDLPTRDMRCREDTTELRQAISRGMESGEATKVLETFLPDVWEGMPTQEHSDGVNVALGVDAALVRVERPAVLERNPVLGFANEPFFEWNSDGTELELREGAGERALFTVGQGVTNCGVENPVPQEEPGSYGIKRIDYRLPTAKEVFETTQAKNAFRLLAEGPLELRLVSTGDTWSCVGDSGSPIIEERDETYLLHGVLGTAGVFFEQEEDGTWASVPRRSDSAVSPRDPHMCALFKKAFEEQPLPESLKEVCANPVPALAPFDFVASGLETPINDLIDAQLGQHTKSDRLTFITPHFDNLEPTPYAVDRALNSNSHVVLTEAATPNAFNYAGVVVVHDVYGTVRTRKVRILAGPR